MAQLQAPARTRRSGHAGRSGKVVGCFFLFTGGLHAGIVAAGTEFYRHFADEALLPFVTAAWRDVFMANPALWGLAVSAGEVGLGVLLLSGGAWATAGWAGVIAFHLALMLFGWGFWLWCVPALGFLVPSAMAHRRRQHQEADVAQHPDAKPPRERGRTV